MFRSLDSEKLLATIRLLTGRIQRVFPGSGLGEVSGEVVAAAEFAVREAEAIKQPLWKLRGAVGAAVILLIAVPPVVWYWLRLRIGFQNFAEFVQATDAGFNVILLLAGGILFLVSAEARLKRRRALKSLDELRSLAHVIDMHQLSKDPGVNLATLDPERPSQSRPPMIHSPEDLWFYLAFCCDLLAVLGKIAAGFASRVTDRSVLDTVNEIEMLCNGIATKIWQKMSFLEAPPADWVAARMPPGGTKD